MNESRRFAARVSLNMLGSSTGEQRVAWSERDSMLYAIGVGAGLGDPARELTFTTENSASITLQTVPSYLTVIAAAIPPAIAALDAGTFLHAGQRIELTRPIPASGCGTVVSKITEVLDKGSSAIVIYETSLRCDEDGDEPTGRTLTSVFVRGGGGFGGPRGTTTLATRPERSPDIRITYASRPEQALLYRLSGDRHRLHSDPRFAGDHGFERPILHGLCTFGFACRALIEGVADGHPTRLRAMEARFSAPAYPGQTLKTEIWVEAPDQVRFCTLNDAGATVLDGGRARITAKQS